MSSDIPEWAISNDDTPESVVSTIEMDFGPCPATLLVPLGELVIGCRLRAHHPMDTDHFHDFTLPRDDPR